MTRRTSKAARSQAACPQCAFELVRQLRRRRRLDSIAPVRRKQPWPQIFYGALELQEQGLELLERDRD